RRDGLGFVFEEEVLGPPQLDDFDVAEGRAEAGQRLLGREAGIAHGVGDERWLGGEPAGHPALEFSEPWTGRGDLSGELRDARAKLGGGLHAAVVIHLLITELAHHAPG